MCMKFDIFCEQHNKIVFYQIFLTIRANILADILLDFWNLKPSLLSMNN